MVHEGHSWFKKKNTKTTPVSAVLPPSDLLFLLRGQLQGSMKVRSIIFLYTLHKLTFFYRTGKIKSDCAEFNNGHAIAESSEYSNNQQQLLSNLNFIMYN